MKNVDEALDFPIGTRIYLNDNQSPVMKDLAPNVAVKVKVAGEIHKITHEMDLVRIAPKYEDFSFDTGISSRVLYDNPDFMDIARMDRLVGAMANTDVLSQ